MIYSDIPLEICVRLETNPRTVNKPVLTVWCYKGTEESGLQWQHYYILMHIYEVQSCPNKQFVKGNIENSFDNLE